MAGWLENLFAPSPGYCPLPESLPAEIDDLLPPLPDPPPPLEPPPSREALLAAAAAAAAAISLGIRREDECEVCETCLAVLRGNGGIPPRMPYADTRTSRTGYEYQHHVVNWFYHDAANRIIMEWKVGDVWFDGLDPKEGTMLATRAIRRPEYDPQLTSYCYLIDTKYGYDSWVRYDAYRERRVPNLPERLFDGLVREVQSQGSTVNGLYPNVAIVWIFSGRHFKEYAETALLQPAGPQFRSVYYPYIATEDRT
jgi:hypothetical protein